MLSERELAELEAEERRLNAEAEAKPTPKTRQGVLMRLRKIQRDYKDRVWFFEHPEQIIFGITDMEAWGAFLLNNGDKVTGTIYIDAHSPRFNMSRDPLKIVLNWVITTNMERFKKMENEVTCTVMTPADLR